MSFEIHYIAQVKNTETGQVMAECPLQAKSVAYPHSFGEFGLRHAEQIQLLKSAQDIFLTYQARLLNESGGVCPKCGRKARKQGTFTSGFHDVFTDHCVNIQRNSCQCGWQSQYTLKGIYGSTVHPELARLQARTGANFSFEKACGLLNDFSGTARKVNNHASVARLIGTAGGILDNHKQSEQWAGRPGTAATGLVVTTDGGHVQARETDKHSFEEMITTVFRPEDLVMSADGIKVLTHRLSVASARQDGQKSIKTMTQNACKKLGMTSETLIVGLTDGASNCWPIMDSLAPHCHQVIKILDWFHMGKKFKERERCLPQEALPFYNKAKWHCWHGRPLTAMARLAQAIGQARQPEALEKLEELKAYIVNNDVSVATSVIVLSS